MILILYLVKLQNKGKIMIRLFIVILLVLSPISVWSMFRPSDCVSASFQGAFSINKGPFGMIPLSMNLKKNRCNLEIEKDFVLKTTWHIDLCREPVHIKQKTWSGDGFQVRKNYPCKENGAYCQLVDELLNDLENDALIYAAGERESLDTDHGKFFCAYLLLKNYLIEGKVFSLTVPNSINIFAKTVLESFGQEVPVVEPATETPSVVEEPKKVKF